MRRSRAAFEVLLVVMAALPSACVSGSPGGIGAAASASARLLRRERMVDTIAWCEQHRSLGGGLLEASLEDADVQVRREAAVAAGRLAHPALLSALMQAARNERADVLPEQLFALGSLGDARALPVIESFFASPYGHVRAAAVRAFSRCAQRAELYRLRPLLDDPETDVRGELAIAAFRLLSAPPAEMERAKKEKRRYYSQPDDEERAFLRALIGDESPHVRWRALWAVGSGRVRMRLHAATVLPSLTDASALVRQFGYLALAVCQDERADQQLLQATPQRTPYERVTLLWALGRVNSPEAVARVLALVDFTQPTPRLPDADFHVHKAALDALEAMKPHAQASPAARTYLEALVRALSSPASPTTMIFLETLTRAVPLPEALSDHPAVQARALGLCADLWPEHAWPLLDATMTTPQPLIEEARALAMGVLKDERARLTLLRMGEDHRRLAAGASDREDFSRHARVLRAVLEALLVFLEPPKTTPREDSAASDAAPERLEPPSFTPPADVVTFIDRVRTFPWVSVRVAAAESYALLPKADAVRRLTAMCRANSDAEYADVAIAALEALAKLRSPTADATVRHAADDARALVRRKAKELLGERFTAMRFPIDEQRDFPARPFPIPRRARAEYPLRLARIDTSRGSLTVELWPTRAPVHVANFEFLASRGFYDGLTFHREVPAFVVQGGCPRGDGSGDPGYQLRHEFNDTSFWRGVIGMPRGGDPDSGGCQLFFMEAPALHLDGQYTAFGRVIPDDWPVLDLLDVGDRIVTIEMLDR